MARMTSKELCRHVESKNYEYQHSTGGHHHYINKAMQAYGEAHGIRMPENLRSCRTADQAPGAVIIPEDLKGDGTEKKILAQVKWCGDTLQREAKRVERAREAKKIRERRCAALASWKNFKKQARDFCTKRNMVDAMPTYPREAVAFLNQIKAPR